MTRQQMAQFLMRSAGTLAAEVADSSGRSTSVTYADVSDALPNEDGTGSAELADREAAISVPGGGDGDVYCVLTDAQFVDPPGRVATVGSNVAIEVRVLGTSSTTR